MLPKTIQSVFSRQFSYAQIVGLLMFVGSPIAVLAQAPASLGGYSYRDNTYRAGLGSYWNALEFHTDGTYTTRALISLDPVAAKGVYSAPLGGSYTYAVTSASQASVTLNPSAAPQEQLSLSFSDTANGTVSRIRSGLAYTGNFSTTPTNGGTATSLLNVSTLLTVQPGSSATIGFVVGGNQLREYLIRAVGPSLSTFGVSSFATNPIYQLNGVVGNFALPGEQQILPAGAAGSGWSATTASTTTLAAEAVRVGAFPLAAGSSDKADIWLLPPGAYTVVVSPTGSGSAGQCLIEVYEVH
jgi:hypothetical protein